MYRIKHKESGLYIVNRQRDQGYFKECIIKAYAKNEKLKNGLVKTGKVFAYKNNAEAWIDDLNKMLDRFKQYKHIEDFYKNLNIDFRNHFEIEELKPN